MERTRTQELKSLWVQRDLRIREMYTLRRLTDELKKKNYESVALNDPKNMVRLATYLLAALPIKHRLPSGEDENEQISNSIVERALTSIWRDLDIQQRHKGRKPWRWEIADLLCMTGWYAVAVDVVESQGAPQFIAEIWNPARVYPAFSDIGLDAVYYEYMISRSALIGKAQNLKWDLSAVNKSIKPNVTIGLLWEIKNSVASQTIYVDGVQVKFLPTELEEIPVFVGAVGGEGRWGGYSNMDTHWDRYFGESVLEANAEIFKAQNRWMSYLMQLIRKAAKSTILHKGGTEGSVTEEDLDKIIDLAPMEDLGAMQTGNIPPQIVAVAQLLQEKIQQGGFNWTLFGSSGPINLSGIAISQLLTSAYAVVGEHHNTLQQLIADIDMRWLNLYKDGKFKSFRVITKKQGRAGLLREEFTRDMIPEQPFVEVTFPLATPRSMIEKLSAARQALPNGPLLDQITVLEELLEVDDPQLVLARLSKEVTQQSVVMQQIKTISDLRTFAQRLRTRPVNPDPQLAALIDQAWQGMLSNLGGEPAQQKGAPGAVGISPEARGQPRSLAAQLFGQQQPNTEEAAQFPNELPPPQGRPTGS